MAAGWRGCSRMSLICGLLPGHQEEVQWGTIAGLQGTSLTSLLLVLVVAGSSCSSTWTLAGGPVAAAAWASDHQLIICASLTPFLHRGKIFPPALLLPSPSATVSPTPNLLVPTGHQYTWSSTASPASARSQWLGRRERGGQTARMHEFIPRLWGAPRSPGDGSVEDQRWAPH